jgi:hypothetical protein
MEEAFRAAIWSIMGKIHQKLSTKESFCAEINGEINCKYELGANDHLHFLQYTDARVEII